jgi:hypothetical protein
MPLNTSNSSHLNLPDFRTSTNQSNPYVEIRGTLKRTKSQYNVIILLQKTVNDKDNLLQATFDVSNDSILSIHADKDISLRIDTQNYELVPNGKRLFDEYVNAGILTKDCVFSSKLFTRIVKEFFSFLKSRNLEIQNLTLDFSIYILPSDSTIRYIDRERENTSVEIKGFTDAFGNLATKYASTSTKTAKFLSFYEKAFTINCKQGTDFYQNIGIGRESLRHIFLPADQTFSIGGLNWVFLDLGDIHQKFKETRRGILSQLTENFKLLHSKGQTKRERSLLKIVCYRGQQQKQEILLDDNLTMDRMQRLFSTLDPKKVPYTTLEVLIFKDRKTVLWDDYLYGIRSFLSETSIPKSRLIASFMRILKRNINDWLKQDKRKRGNAIDFFNKADFCLKTLSIRNTREPDMNVSEKFAYNVGIIARLYVDFKDQVEEKSNSLRDILTYTKYDREKLHFVFSRIGLGINLSKAKEDKKAQISKDVSRHTPHEEIPESDAFNDYSYFFYKGYFQGGSDNK